MVEALDKHKLDVRHDGPLSISLGTSVSDTHWKNRTLTWSSLLHKLQTATITPETHADFMKKPKKDQDRIKDIGGFVGGRLKGGRRKKENVEGRQLVTLDADDAPAGLAESLDLTLGCAYAVYSTHKHTASRPRLRILIPLDREVSPEEHEAIARKLADRIGIDYFDDTTYEGNRMMFWPSVPSDIDYFFDYCDDEWLSADSVLAEYPDWHDVSYWPESRKARELRKKTVDRQADPTEKEGLIGAFCRAYTLTEAIGKFLSDVYAATASPDRYTYTEGSTSAGLVVYDDKFAFSHHATDPASMRLLNAFDLVRVHKFGSLDEDTDPGTAVNRLPSFKAMQEFCRKDRETVNTIVREKRDRAKKDYAEADDDDNWTGDLETSKKGEIMGTLNNCRLILQHDSALKGIVYNQLADNLEIIEPVPWQEERTFWRDSDDAQLENYLAEAYTEFPKAKILSAVTKVADDRAYHPIRRYMEALPEWDQVPRVDTLLIDYLGASDNTYTRAAIRKTLCAAYRRLYHPGTKFDCMLIPNGGQGIGKSTLISRLGMEWYSDSLSISDMHDKTAAEKLQGFWLIEIGEMAGMRKADIDKVKAFISRQDDKYRASYGRRVQSHPRQCVLFGTTNDDEGYLRDITGNRRYWNVVVTGRGRYKPWDLTQDVVDQIWAEVKVIDAKGEELFLSPEEERLAEAEQAKALEYNPMEDLIREYLEMLLPDNWDEMDPYDRRDYFRDRYENDVRLNGHQKRTEVTVAEIWVECLGMKREDLQRKDSFTIAGALTRIGGWRKAMKSKRVRYYGMQKYYVTKP